MSATDARVLGNPVQLSRSPVDLPRSAVPVTHG